VKSPGGGYRGRTSFDTSSALLRGHLFVLKV
jgi:hypothetical protein